MRFSRVLLVLALLAIMLASNGMVYADAAINIVNPGFDYTTWHSSSPATTHTNSTGWSNAPLVGDGTTAIAFNPWPAGSDNTMVIEGWYSANTQGGVEQLDSNSSFWLAGNYPGDGNAVGNANHSTTLGNGTLTQTISGLLQANASYTLTADLYARAGTAFPTIEDTVFTLADGNGTALTGGLKTIVLPTDGAKGSATFTLTTGSIPTGDLMIMLGIATEGSTFTTVAFDNVALSSSATIPEPNSIVLVTIGCLCMLACSRKNRK